MARSSGSKPPGAPVRRAAFDLLEAVLRRGETLEQAEPAALRSVTGPADRAFARAIATETLRWLVDMDALIDSATRTVLPDDAKARGVLRIMLAQTLRLGTPAHAVIATGLDLLAGGQRRLVHGVFSALTKSGAGLPEVPNLPGPVRARWGEWAQEVAHGLIDPPEVDLALKDRGSAPVRALEMGGVSLAPGHVRLPRGTPIEQLPSYSEGEWWVQDLGAQIPASLLDEGEGRRVLDLCAAPGGKTLALASAGWSVTALDMNGRRLERLRKNLARTGLTAEIVKANALTYVPAKRSDAILLDAPCTATGTCRRHPDVLHRIGARQIEELVAVQRRLIERAIGWMEPGTTFVYAVCSLEREEGEDQAAWIGERFDIEPVAIAADELPAELPPTAEGWLRTHPGMLADEGGLDGFFVARWRKT